MTLGRRLALYLIVLHCVLFAFTVLLYRATPLLMIALEVLLLASLWGGLVLVRRALEPLAYTQRFRDLLQDQEYASRLSSPGAPELDQLVALFNNMLATLYRERLALGEQRGLLGSLLEATPGAVLVFDFDGKISLMNASAHTLLDLGEAVGTPLADWAAAAGPASLLAQLDALPLHESRLLTDPDGRCYRGQRGAFLDRGFARHFLMVEEMTDELAASERATYEKLIRVLAHEVNNTVAATGSVLDSLLFYSGQLSARDSSDFTTAIEAVKRRNVSLGEFLERFTRVIKMPAPELRPTGIAAMMDDILWLNREQGKQRGIEIGWSRCDQVPALPMDSQLMEQALLNIVKNALEAVEASGQEGGTIRFELADEGERVRLTVSDSGNQLGELPARQLFTPFFTTKKGGQGIGLMFVREVLNRHAFAYRLAANGSGETHFTIWFPAAAAVN